VTVQPPRPHQLVEFPELAALELLDAALTVAVNALLAVHPAVASERFAREPPGPTPLACLADAIAAQADALQTILTRYRNFAAHAQDFSELDQALALDAREQDDDLPF
jgi:hypothetical protein